MRHVHAQDASSSRPSATEAWRGPRLSTPSPCCRARTRSAAAGSTRCSRRAASPQRYRADPTCAGCARTSSPSPGCWRRPAGPCGRPSTPRSPRWPAHRTRRPGDRAAVGRPVPAGGTRRRGHGRGSASGCWRASGCSASACRRSLIRQGARPIPPLSPTELVDRSGLREIEQVLHTQFTERRDVLKARSALLAVDAVLRDDRAGTARVRWPARSTESSRGRTSSPSCGCSARCAAARSPCPPATPTTVSGCSATPAPHRPPGSASPPTRRRSSWRTRPTRRSSGGSATWPTPCSSRATTDACRAVVRSCEGILAGLGTLA